jgi:uncharacterized protein (DUF58 family)
MRLTRPCFGLLAVAGGLVVAGRLLGVVELFLLAGVTLAAVAGAVVLTGTRRLRLAVSRQASPRRLRVGTPARIDLSIENRSRRATPVLALRDRVEGLGAAEVSLAPIPAGGRTQVSYRLPTQRRGPLLVGPLDIEFGDPLGLTAARVSAASRSELLVHPELVELGPLRAGTGALNGAERQAVRTLAPTGDEFFALRPYVVGDELRRVHWRNSARTDDLVVRQEERPRRGQVIVLLDLRREAYDDEAFERAVSAAASALHAGWAGGDTLRFLTSNAGDSGVITQRSQLDIIDDQLARIGTTPIASCARAVEHAGRTARGGTLVVVTGRVGAEVAAAVARSRRSFGTVVLVTCRPDAGDPAGVIVHDGTADLAAQWHRALWRPTGRLAGRR